jgi:hypothetical protein
MIVNKALDCYAVKPIAQIVAAGPENIANGVKRRITAAPQTNPVYAPQLPGHNFPPLISSMMCCSNFFII